MTTPPRHRLLCVVLLAACDESSEQADGPRFIDARIDGAACGGCNVLTQCGCHAGEKCTWIRVSTGAESDEQLGQIGCAPAGPAALDEACSYGASGPTTGFDGCTAGMICYADPAFEQAVGTCAPICSLYDGTAPCTAGFACTARSKFFSNTTSDTPLAGLCAATCNPLTQTRDIDLAPACGSANPSMPDQGCYRSPSTSDAPTVFTCMGAGTLGHGEAGPTPSFTNACLPGAVPLTYLTKGQSGPACIAMCQPLTVNTTQPDEARDGAEPYSCPEMPPGVGVAGPVARATGPNERCQHLWFWEGGATPSAAGNAYGFCVDPTVYTWDEDQDPSTPPVPWSMPETLDPYVDAMNPQPNEDLFWGYAPLP